MRNGNYKLCSIGLALLYGDARRHRGSWHDCQPAGLVCQARHGGKPGPDQIRILDDDGQPVEGSTPGQLFLINPPNSQFNYYKDPTKTESAVKNGYFNT